MLGGNTLEKICSGNRSWKHCALIHDPCTNLKIRMMSKQLFIGIFGFPTIFYGRRYLSFIGRIHIARKNVCIGEPKTRVPFAKGTVFNSSTSPWHQKSIITRCYHRVSSPGCYHPGNITQVSCFGLSIEQTTYI